MSTAKSSKSPSPPLQSAEESEFIRLASEAAEKAGLPWNSASVAVTPPLFRVFPVWRVTSTLPGGRHVVRATVKKGAAQPISIETQSTGAWPDGTYLRIARIALQTIALCGICFGCLRRFVPSGVLEDATVAVAFALLVTYAVESYLAKRAFLRDFRPR